MPEATSYPTLADLDRDGFLDMINASRSGRSNVLWGGRTGFGDRKPLFLKTDPSTTSRVADLDGDGWLDLIFTGAYSLEIKSLRAKSYIYYGSPEGFLERPPVLLPRYASLEAGIGDLDRDGTLDLVFSNYSDGLNRSLPVFLYWGDADGRFQEHRRTDLPAESSSGIQVLDLNRDGYPEIVVHNHILNGRHDFGAYIYWGGAQGYSIDRRIQLPTSATHMSNILEPGNVYTRRLEEEYLSPPVPKPSSREVILHWDASTPPLALVSDFKCEEGQQKKRWSSRSGLAPPAPDPTFANLAVACPSN